MLNKQDIISKVTAFLSEAGICPEELVVGSKGAMVMMGLADLTNDIDVYVSNELFDRFLKEGYSTHTFTSSTGEEVLVIEVTEDIDVHRNDHKTSKKLVNGIWIESMRDVLMFKTALNRPKDTGDILVLQRYLLQESYRHSGTLAKQLLDEQVPAKWNIVSSSMVESQLTDPRP